MPVVYFCGENMKIEDYLRQLNTKKEVFQEVFEYAVEHRVPIIDSDALTLLKQIIQITKSKKILEIGTAIGYSGLHMLNVNEDVMLTTIEKNEESYNIAKNNFKAYNVSERVTQILGDAKEVEINDTFDLMFIDASKGNNLLFFEKFSELLSEDGIVVVDNILLRGQIVDNNLESKNRIKLRDKVQKFNEYIYENYPSASFLNIGDGLLIINK